MAFELLRTSVAINECEEHLDSTETFGTPVESYLTQHILVIFCAEIQQSIYNMIEERANSAGDNNIKSYMVASVNRILRSAKKERIAEIAGFFGDDVKTRFNDSLDDRDVTLYGNATKDRDDVAHRYGSELTFNELKEAVEAGNKILEAFQIAITPPSPVL